MKKILELGTKSISIKEIYHFIQQAADLKISSEAMQNVANCRLFLDDKVRRTEKPIYGINTGFGSLCNIKISEHQLEQLQENLVKSHACGTGEEAPAEIIRLMLLLKIQNMLLGHSGVQTQTVDAMVTLLKNDCLPLVYQLGSLGASGDLAPLAHLALPLLGMGEVYLKGKKISSAEALQKIGLQPIALKSKEGLALLNGTQFMSAYGVYCTRKALRLSYLADLISAISLDAYDGRIEAFDEKIHAIRPHIGQRKTAERIREFLTDSELITRPKTHVQDPYSYRCIPQVHGATKDAIAYVRGVVETEINSVTDNPLIFIEEDEILSGGNFHGQPLAISFDFLAIAVAELGNISERRIYQLVNGKRGLPPFLVSDAGLNSGLMIPQYTAAGIVSQNKQLCTPASVDSIESSNGQEDHVSMGANAATKLFQVVENVERILAIELLNASQALSFREEKTSPFLQAFVDAFRERVPVIVQDRILYTDIQEAIEFLQNVDIEDNLLFG